jgi:hypothetical protein
MCSVRQRPDPLRAELARLGRVLGQVRVRAHLEAAHLVGPAEHDAERPGRLRRHHRHLADHDLTGPAVDRDDLALADLHLDRAHDPADLAVDRHRELLAGEIDVQRLGTADRGRAHAPGDDGGVADEPAA